jgi:hypothetical protein
MSSRPALGSTQSPIKWVPGALSPRIKRPGREADHSPPDSADVKKNVDLYIHSPIRLHGVVFEHRNNFSLPYQYSCTPEDDPRKGPKHVALPPTANKTNVDTVVSVCLSVSELLLCRLSHYVSFVWHTTGCSP